MAGVAKATRAHDAEEGQAERFTWGLPVVMSNARKLRALHHGLAEPLSFTRKASIAYSHCLRSTHAGSSEMTAIGRHDVDNRTLEVRE
jgi:hypothetical protein